MVPNLVARGSNFTRHLRKPPHIRPALKEGGCGAVTVEDLGSSNGTKVGDQRLAPNQPVAATNGTPINSNERRLTRFMLDEG